MVGLLLLGTCLSSAKHFLCLLLDQLSLLNFLCQSLQDVAHSVVNILQCNFRKKCNGMILVQVNY